MATTVLSLPPTGMQQVKDIVSTCVRWLGCPLQGRWDDGSGVSGSTLAAFRLLRQGSMNPGLENGAESDGPSFPLGRRGGMLIGGDIS